jgi:hypothetical protein
MLVVETTGRRQLPTRTNRLEKTYSPLVLDKHWDSASRYARLPAFWVDSAPSYSDSPFQSK